MGAHRKRLLMASVRREHFWCGRFGVAVSGVWILSETT